MAVIKSGASTDQLTVDATSKAARITDYDTTGRDLSMQSKATYSCVTAGFTPAATATDIFTIYGSATKTIRIVSIIMGGTATAASIVDAFVIKRSTVNTTGTFVAGTAVPHDANDAAATATAFGHYTANPGALGTAVGTVVRRKVLLPIATTAAEPMGSLLIDGASTLLDKPIVLRGTSQGIVINNNSAAIPAGGANWYVCCTWIEE